MTIKHQLYNCCIEFVEQREQKITDIMRSHQMSLSSETKSSAGDKHETGRAMIQLEMEKASQQIQVVQQMKETLAKINLEPSNHHIRLGSLVKTTNTSYFLSISAGQFIVESNAYFAISVSSPIGKQLLGKSKNESLVFNGAALTILDVL